LEIKPKELQELLDQIGLKQTEIAEVLGIDSQTISRWKRSGGMSRSTFKKLKEWAETGIKPGTATQAILLSQATLDQIVEELDKRGWNVDLRRVNPELRKPK
jgi:transcriptional regulator with XRE-family HTH domain